jgi:hypothetical protein
MAEFSFFLPDKSGAPFPPDDPAPGDDGSGPELESLSDVLSETLAPLIDQ